WAAQLFGPGHRDGPDAAAGISLAVAPDRGADDIHLRTAGGGAERARPQYLEPPGDEAHANFQGLSPARWAGLFADRQHGLKVFGAGEWLQERHGARARRTWRKLHLAVDADTGIIMASILTGNDVGDPSQVGPLLDQIEATVVSVTADGAYDGM